MMSTRTRPSEDASYDAGAVAVADLVRLLAGSRCEQCALLTGTTAAAPPRGGAPAAARLHVPEDTSRVANALAAMPDDMYHMI